MISGIAHINITVPPGSLDQAEAFYSNTLGMIRTTVPALQKDSLAWFNIADSGQQVHVSCNGTPNDQAASRHPCFKIESPEKLLELQQKVYEHHGRGDKGAPLEADAVGVSSGAKGVEYPKRFFARDYAGNRLEFSV